VADEGGLFGGIGAVAAGAVKELVTELASFTRFQQRVDDLIRDLKESPASPGKVGEEQIARAQFGGGAGSWAEAAGLSSSYETVISELEKLSKLLSDSIEGMGIAVLASHEGYENIDVDIRERMAAISTEATKEYGGAYDPGAPKQPDGGAPAAPAEEQAGGQI
jgi:hypothetical protein